MSAARESMQRSHLHIINHLLTPNDEPPREIFAYLLNSEGIFRHAEMFQVDVFLGQIANRTTAFTS